MIFGGLPMSTDAPAIAQALQALSRSSAARTKSSRLRELLPEIEAAQAAGVKHEHILETLNAHGFDLSKKSYSVMLWRLRQQAKHLDTSGSSPAIPPASTAAAGSVTTENAPSSTDGASPTNPSLSASTPAPQAAPKPGEPQRFDWETLKNTRPEW